MENKEKEIDEFQNDIIDNLFNGGTYGLAEALYNAGYRKTFTSDLASETQRAYKDGYRKGFEDGEEELKNEIYALKVQIECLEEYCTALEEDNINDEMNLDSLSKELEIISSELSRYTENAKTMCEETKKQAIKEFAEKLKYILFEKGGVRDVPYGEFVKENAVCLLLDDLLKEFLNE